MKVINQSKGCNWILYNGDCCEIIQHLPDNSIGYSIFSPPFSNLYVYSNSLRDMGNSSNNEEFYNHFRFLIKELMRILKSGRNISIHCCDIPAMKERDGYIGLKDFSGDVRYMFESEGFIYHSKHIIWKDPLIEAVRTKSLGLMHKQVCKDSAMCRAGLPDYLITMRKPGENKEPVKHENGFEYYIGEPEQEPKQKGIQYSHNIWRKYASPVWMDIDQTNTLNIKAARDSKDERHICPLQLDVISRGIELWSNENDVVLSPFAGIGSEGYVSIKNKRKFIGIELKDSYYNQAIKYLTQAEKSNESNTLPGFN